MPTIIAIETSSEIASAALLCGDQLIARATTGVQTHSQSILPMVQSVLAQAGIGLAQCDAVAFGAGPGSFTGVRTACGIAQGLAFGLDLPVLAVVTLQAMAQACREVSGASDVLAVLDARMGEVYWAQYRYTDRWLTVTAPTLSAPSELVARGTVTACGNGMSVYADAFAAHSFAVDARPDLMPHARWIAQVARSELAQGMAVAARDAQPIYLRNKIALTTSERLAKATT
ncbi:MAG TPA: tRNA (adenosine(37)-N6)-threonylcarbamoyltransferase complex dimerization subunit type 1 TsaB [Oxalobacteraceae bacterium]|jgi:tRNA threonylcarbamoyladenosine biosynthesis protein TsaB|nr:tRNA (adenosine(37)-N6)-threonylcarbamoyltransferase complex dimerization subunit type 1 TsaB [Oxalobacteraceae bacterium]HCN89362.1 tRNA (adenosine(37)-N6)-threonylcarbamoyltransferase complex dimerization subunit type 1 TsaB [Oxalobacteraceae bacterium]